MATILKHHFQFIKHANFTFILIINILIIRLLSFSLINFFNLNTTAHHLIIIFFWFFKFANLA